MKNIYSTFLALLLPAAGLIPGSAAAGALDRWVNIRDHGASGSEFTTRGAIEVDSRKVTVADVGDFEVGQGVAIYGADVRFEDARIYDPGQITLHHPVEEEIEIRGFHGEDADSRTFALEIEEADPLTFRWTNDYANNWTTGVPVTGDWQLLSDGVEVRFKTEGWKQAHLIVFHARNDLISEIESIDGATLTLKHAATSAVAEATVRHHDREALIRALRTALETKQNLFIPAGRYLLSPLGLGLPNDASIRIEGANPETTILDLSEGKYHTLRLDGTKNVTVANLSMVGNSGWRKWPLSFERIDGGNFWTCNLRPTRGIAIGNGAEHTLIENVHASQMSGECFYAHGKYREGSKPAPERYQKSLTYLRCRVTDVLFNAFNNNDFGENTSILHCYVDGASNFWEGPSRFTRVIGNHVRNCDHYGTFGNNYRRSAHLEELGVGQAIIANNVFEGLEALSDDPAYARKGTGPAVYTPSTQVIIRDNHFVNFSSGAALRLGVNRHPGFPTGRIIASGNTIDLTAVEGRTDNPRVGIIVGTSNVTVSDNQIFVRGGPVPHTTGIRIEHDTTNVTVHDNIIRGCYAGIATEPSAAAVRDVIEPGVFLADARVDKVRPSSHRYRGWNVHWQSGANEGKQTSIADFDPESLAFTLTEPQVVTAGDKFVIYPSQANWMIHHNTMSDCNYAAILHGYGGDTSIFSDNLMTRGQAETKIGMVLQGAFFVTRNTFAGYNDPKFGAIHLRRDPFGNHHRERCVDNVFRDCTNKIVE